MADDVLVMYAGRAVEYGTCDEIFYAPEHPYTWGLLSSMPRMDRLRLEPSDPDPGQPALPDLNLPSGCAFHPRCAYRDEARLGCSRSVPDLDASSPAPRAVPDRP